MDWFFLPNFAEAINFSGFPDPNNTPTDDLSRALLIIIREEAGEEKIELPKITETTEEKPRMNLGAFLAAMGGFFRTENLCWILIILIAVLIILFALSGKKKTPEAEKKQWSWFLLPFIVLLIVLHCLLCLYCLYLIIFAAAASLFILGLLFRRKKRIT